MRDKGMADKQLYSYADVIIDPADPRVEIGAEYYFASYPRECLHRAIEGNFLAKYVHAYTEGAYDSFLMNWAGAMISAACLIRKEEPKKKYVPFDLSKPEVRDGLRGKWIRLKTLTEDGVYEERMITDFTSVNGIWSTRSLDEAELLRDWTFLDGSPCGQAVAE